MNMKEKVAKAIFEEMAKNGIIPINWTTDIAKVAIEALLEPTEELFNFDTGGNDVFMWNCKCMYCGGHKFAVQAYLKQALLDK